MQSVLLARIREQTVAPGAPPARAVPGERTAAQLFSVAQLRAGHDAVAAGAAGRAAAALVLPLWVMISAPVGKR